VKDRTVVVTGAASGIGNAIAILLAKSGWTVIACDIDVAKLVQLNQVPNISTIHLDVRSKSSTELLRKHVDRRFPRGLDAVVREISVCINLSLSLSFPPTHTNLKQVNCAGINIPAPLIESSIESIEKTMSVNCVGPIRVVKSLMSSLIKSGGTVLNVSSTTSHSAWPFTGAYSMSKAALECASEQIRREAIANNLDLRVVLVVPGPVNTPMASQAPYRALKWCDANTSSCWEPAMRRSAERSRDAMKRWNLTPSSFRLGYTASEVAAVCSTALTSKNPRARYYCVRGPFLWLLRFTGIMPTEIGDAVMARV
jgi:NAD(P)-dependent dehydrogenase (short-subunit alcohol dehydrogenase family)